MYLKVPKCTYDNHFIIKELAQELKKQITCLREKTEKYITSTVPIEEEVRRIGQMEKKLQNIYLIYFNLLIAQDMANSLLALATNFLEEINRIKSKCGHDDKKCKTYKIECKYCNCFLEHTILKTI